MGRILPCCISLVLPTFLAAPLAAQIVDLTERGSLSGLDAIHAPSAFSMPPTAMRLTGGAAVGDFDRDGDQDIFWIGGGLTADRLYLNEGDGTFLDAAADWGVDTPHGGNGVAVGDVDGDGWLDVYVTSFGPIDAEGGEIGHNRLYHNQAGTGFIDIALSAGVNVSSAIWPDGFGAAFGDYDLDGDLDLFVAAWLHGSQGNRLFRNDTDAGVIAFTDVTDIAIPSNIINVHGFQPAFADMDDDCYPELLLTGDHELSRYYMNMTNGVFQKTVEAQGLGLDDNGMGQTIGDFDNDGRFDWYVTSIYLDDPPAWNNPGNMLYRNLGSHFYDEVSEESGTLDGGWGWGAVAVDLNHDGWEDIVEVNGWSPGWFEEFADERAKLFLNTGAGTFLEVAALCGLDHTQRGRAIVRLDAEGDGDQDLVITAREAAIEYYVNDTPGAGHWLRLMFDTSTNPVMAPDGFGTRVEIDTPGLTQRRVMNGSPSYLGTSELSVHFGVGDTTVIDEVRVIWPRCRTSVLTDVAADTHMTLTAPVPGDITADGFVGIDDLLALIADWGDVVGTDGLRSDLDADGDVDIDDLLGVLTDWR